MSLFQAHSGDSSIYKGWGLRVDKGETVGWLPMTCPGGLSPSCGPNLTSRPEDPWPLTSLPGGQATTIHTLRQGEEEIPSIREWVAFFFFMYYLCLWDECMCECWFTLMDITCVHTNAVFCMWISEDNFMESFFSFFCVGIGDQTQPFRLVTSTFSPGSCVVGPRPFTPPCMHAHWSLLVSNCPSQSCL